MVFLKTFYVSYSNEMHHKRCCILIALSVIYKTGSMSELDVAYKLTA